MYTNKFCFANRFACGSSNGNMYIMFNDCYFFSIFLVAEETAILLLLKLCTVLFNLPQLDEMFEKTI